MPFTGAGNPVTLGWLKRQLADPACPVTAEEIAFFKAIPGMLCAEDVTAPEYSLALYIFDGGVKENDFILAARATGTPRSQSIFKHILPNSIAPIAVAATLGVADAIILEAYISFLGMGVRAPTATWGNMLQCAYNYIESAWWLWLFPGLPMALTVLSINFIGDGLRDALDPRSRTI